MNQSVNGQYVNKALMDSQEYIIAMTDYNVYIFDENFQLKRETISFSKGELLDVDTLINGPQKRIYPADIK